MNPGVLRATHTTLSTGGSSNIIFTLGCILSYIVYFYYIMDHLLCFYDLIDPLIYL